MNAALSHEEARRFYDGYGAKQDSQGFYEDAALDLLIEHGDFGPSRSVLEIGCGTGRFAARLLSDHMPPSARYVGIDVSSTMAELSRERLKPWAERSTIHHTEGGFEFASLGGPFDRIVSTYVFDLLSDADVAEALAAARCVTSDGGRLCLAGLSGGKGPISSLTSGLWTLAYKISPWFVGGCRPMDLTALLPREQWRVRHHEISVSSLIPSEVLVAEAA